MKIKFEPIPPGWDIKDDLRLMETPWHIEVKKAAHKYDEYIAEKLIALDINPDVLLHQQQEIERLKRKLNIALEDIRKNCRTCLYREISLSEPPCVNCEVFEFNNWQWRGDVE